MKLYILRYEILNKELKQDLELEKEIKLIIKSTPKLYEQEVVSEEGIKYEFAGVPIRNDFYNMYSLKKAGEASITHVEKESADMKKKRVANDDLARFVIYFHENLIFFQYFGHFGLDQFKKTVVELVRKALDAEEIQKEYIFQIKSLNCQPVNWKMENLNSHLENIKIIKKLNLSVNIFDRDKETPILLRKEGYILQDKDGIVLSEEIIANIIYNKEYYLRNNKEEDISFECEDGEGHPFTINRNSKILNFEVRTTFDNEIFLEKIKNAYDEYLKLYN